MRSNITLQGTVHQGCAALFQVVLKFFTRTRYQAILILICIAPSLYGQGCQLQVSEIFGPTNACAYIQASAVYSVDAALGHGFVWSVPSNAYILSGQGTNMIFVRYKNSFSSGVISVEVTSLCLGGPIVRTLNITKTPPSTAPVIEGPAYVGEQVISGAQVTYTLTPVADAASYRWTVPGQATIISGQGTTSLTVVFSPRFKSGQIKVRAVSGCGHGPLSAFAVTSKGALTAGLIAGATSVSSASRLNISSTGQDAASNETPLCEVQIFPVPTAGLLNLKVCTAGSGSYQFYVKHITGCGTVFSTSGTFVAGENDVCLDLSALQDGCYILSLTSKELNVHKRIEIRHGL